MKPIDYIATNPSIEDMQSKALLFKASLYHAMHAKQGNIDTNHLVSPVLLTDGRYGICCDILSETGEGHIFHELFGVLDKAILNTAELVDMTELVALLPVEEEI
jgi:hypothetical protein